MIEMTVSGRGVYRIQHLVFDVEGTITVDGKFVESIYRLLTNLKDRVDIHLLTPESNRMRPVLERRLGISVAVLDPIDETAQKKAYVAKLGAENSAAIGQGTADAGMLSEAGLGICIMSPEGAAVEALMAADIVVPSIGEALDLFANPLRIVNTLRR